MNKNKKIEDLVDFEDILRRELKNPEFKKLYDEHGRQLEIAYQILQLRKKRNYRKLNWQGR